MLQIRCLGEYALYVQIDMFARVNVILNINEKSNLDSQTKT